MKGRGGQLEKGKKQQIYQNEKEKNTESPIIQRETPQRARKLYRK